MEERLWAAGESDVSCSPLRKCSYLLRSSEFRFLFFCIFLFQTGDSLRSYFYLILSIFMKGRWRENQRKKSKETVFVVDPTFLSREFFSCVARDGIQGTADIRADCLVGSLAYKMDRDKRDDCLRLSGAAMVYNTHTHTQPFDIEKCFEKNRPILPKKKLLFLNSGFSSCFLIYSLMRIDDDSLNVFLLPKKKEKKMGGGEVCCFFPGRL